MIPYMDPGIFDIMEWREGDIIVNCPPKSGTNWTMNIVHQILTGGDSDFEDIYQVHFNLRQRQALHNFEDSLPLR